MDTPFESTQPIAVPDNPFQNSKKNAKPLYVIGLVLGVIALGVAIFFLIRSQQGVITITDIQSDYSITLNNQKVSSKNPTVHIAKRPGTYRLTILRPNYQPFVQDVQIDKQKKITVRPTFTVVDGQSIPTSVASVDHAFVSPDQKYMYFLGEGRKHLYRLSISDKIQSILTDKPLNNVLDIAWSLDPDLALITQADGVYLQEIPKYDFKNQTLVKISGPELVSPTWDPTTHSTRMAFAYYPPSGEKSLVFADKRLQTLDRKADLSTLPRVDLTWSPDARYVALVGVSENSKENNLWIYTTSNGSLNQITKNGGISSVQFSTGGRSLAYETAEGIFIINPENGSAIHGQAIPSKLDFAAWKDDTFFMVADSDRKTITVYDLNKSTQKEIPCMFPNTDPIKGMFYFSSNHNLIYYTAQGIYTSVMTF